VSFITKIKYEYHRRVLNDLKKNSNSSILIKELCKITDHETFFKLAEENMIDLLKNTQNEILNSKIIWLNSFFEEGQDLLEDFIYFYLKNFYPELNQFDNYENLLHRKYSNFQKLKSPPDEYFINNSYLFQWLILKDLNEDSFFIKNRFSFFSNSQNLNFTNRSLTKNYLLLIEHPYRAYQKIKDNCNGDQELAKNIFLNLDQRSDPIEIDNFKYFIPQNGWLNHSKSWLDLNVLDSLKGLIIQKENIIKSPSESFIKIIMHLIQGGLKVELSYEIIDQFIQKNNFNENDLPPINISNNEKKFLRNYLKDINELIDYEL